MSENASEAAVVAEIDLFAYLGTLWRYRRAILLLFFATVAFTAALSFWIIPPTYEAVSLIQVGQDLSLGSPDAYRNLLTSRPVLTQTARATGVKIQALKGVLRAQAVPNTNVVRLVAQADSPGRAKALGEAWQAAFRMTLQGIHTDRLERQLAGQRAYLEGLRKAWEGLLETTSGSREPAKSGRQILVTGDVAVAAGEVARLEQVKAQVSRGVLFDATAVAPFEAEKDPVAPRKALNVAVAGFLALIVGVLGVFGAEAWRTRASLAG